MNTKIRKVSELKPNPDNPRIIRDEKFNKLLKSVKDFPKMLELRPIVIDEQDVVLGGNMRLKAIKEAGIKEVPVLIVTELTEEEKKEFIIKDNIGYGDWDWAKLEEWGTDEEMDDWGIDLPEFNLDTLDYAILEEEEEALQEDLENMKGSIRKAIQIEFEPEHYDEANELVRFWREQKLYIGGFLIEKLKEEKTKK